MIGRAAWRSGQARRSAAAAVVAAAAVFGFRVVTIPLSLRIAGPEGYGLWLAAGSLIAWANLADLGIGAGLVHSVATARAAQNWTAARRHVSTAAISFAALALPLAAVAVLAGHSSRILALLGAAHKPALQAQAAALVSIAGLAFAASFALNWAGPLCAALQEGYRASAASAAAGLTTVICLWTIAGKHVSLTVFALASAIPPVAGAALLAAGLAAGRHRRIAWPSLGSFHWGSVRTVMGQGGPLFLVQLSDIAILNTANLFIAHFQGLAAVVRYSVPLAMFSVVGKICYAISTAYWPAYADAFAREDWGWLRSAARGNLAVAAAVMTLAGACFVAVGRPLILWWAGPAALPPAGLLPALAFYSLAAACAAANGSLLNGLGMAPLRARVRVVAAGVHVAGSWLLLPRLGLVAIPLAGGAAFMLEFAVSAVAARRHLAGAIRQPVCLVAYANERA
jgi:O-antigen/teichoic acid export membrane protein